ncbi:MAG: DUF2220 family protein [Kiritimatiellia bacterium]
MPDAFARLLRRLMADGRIPRSQLSGRSRQELGSLFDAGVLAQARSGGGLVVEVRDPPTLAAFYQKRYPAGDRKMEGPPRALAVGMLRNAKRADRTDLEPVLIRAFTAAEACRGSERINLLAETIRNGCCCLTLEPGRFWTLSGVVAVVENLECFLHFERMKVAADVALYAKGRLSRLALQWLGSPELAACRFIHCGDYDPVGLDEFLRLKNAVADRTNLHVPQDLARLVREHGRPELLADSAAVLRRLRHSDDPDIRTVVHILDETGCGLEQEALLLSK